MSNAPFCMTRVKITCGEMQTLLAKNGMRIHENATVDVRFLEPPGNRTMAPAEPNMGSWIQGELQGQIQGQSQAWISR